MPSKSGATVSRPGRGHDSCRAPSRMAADTAHGVWPLWLSIVLFLAATATIGAAGPRLARAADRIADLTGMGEAVTGAVFLGATTSLPGIVTSVTTGWQGYPEFAVSHALGGIAVQTAFLAVVDLVYRKANLEHAAASVGNTLQAAALLAMLSMVLVATALPPVTVWGVHPMTFGLVAVYAFAVRLTYASFEQPMWHPRRTVSTTVDEPPRDEGRRRPRLRGTWLRFGGLAALVGGAGYAIAEAGTSIVAHTGLSQTLMGGLFTTLSTSLPELVTAIAAVRAGALTLAVSGIIGGNSFDTLLVGLADAAYRPGSIYHTIAEAQVFLVAVTMLMTSVVLMGLLHREERGVWNIGFESFVVLLLYAGTVVLLVVRG